MHVRTYVCIYIRMRIHTYIYIYTYIYSLFEVCLLNFGGLQEIIQTLHPNPYTETQCLNPKGLNIEMSEPYA